MADASFSQGNFLGGEWSLSFQGRIDHPNYKKAMAKCRNGMPQAEGSLVRRPGINFVAPTRSGAAGRLIAFQFPSGVPYSLELTDTHLRCLNGPSLVFNNDSVSVTAISTATPAVITIASDQGWATNTQIQFFLASPTYPDAGAVLQNRQYIVTRLTGTTYSIADSVTGTSIVGTTIGYDFTHAPATAKSILDVAAPWTGTTWQNTRLVQGSAYNALLNPAVKPYTLILTPTADTTIATATLAAANMLDGPYLDVDTSGAFLQPFWADVTKTNMVSFYISFPNYDANISYNIGAFVISSSVAYKSLVDDNLGNTPASNPTFWAVADAGDINGAGTGGFTSADVGRCVRFLSEPAAYVAGTTYAADAPVKYNGVYYKSLGAGNVGNVPDANVDKWIITNDTATARWTWGRITSTGSGASPRFICEIIGDAMLYVTGAAGDTYVYSFRFGVYGGGGGHGWPACGVFHQGRLWLGGAVANRFDSSKSNDFFNFSPTGADGTVADNNAISGTFNSAEINQIYWMVTSGQGILCGTKGGEWLVQASSLNDPLSPTNIQANEVTHYGCANIPPIKTGLATVFVQKYQRKAMEFLADVFSGKFSAPDLTEAAKHLTAYKIQELAYQEEPIPTIWVRALDTQGNGQLLGITYRRTSPFITEAPSFAAWHAHTVTGTAAFTTDSIIVGPADQSATTVDVLSAVMNDTTAGYRKVVTMTVPRTEDDVRYAGHHLDDAVVPYNCLVTTVAGAQGLQIYGLHNFDGQDVDVWACGLDLGTFHVASGAGTTFVPFGAGQTTAVQNLFTLALVQSFDGLTANFPTTISRASAGSGATAYRFPLAVGHTYTSEFQILRPGTAEEAGSRNGPPFGKTRRAHQGAIQVVNCVTGSIDIGVQDTNRTIASTLRSAAFKTQGNTAYAPTDLFTGIHWYNLDDDYNFDTMLYWRVTRPYPMIVCQIGAFVHTQDR